MFLVHVEAFLEIRATLDIAQFDSMAISISARGSAWSFKFRGSLGPDKVGFQGHSVPFILASTAPLHDAKRLTTTRGSVEEQLSWQRPSHSAPAWGRVSHLLRTMRIDKPTTARCAASWTLFLMVFYQPPHLQPPAIFSPPRPLTNNPAPSFSDGGSYGGVLDKLANILGLSAFASLLSGPNASIFNAAWLFLLGSIFETGRQVCRWAMDRFKVREWIFSILFSTRLKENRVLRYGRILRRRSVPRMDRQLSCENFGLGC